MEGKEKGRKKGRKESSFPSQNGVLPLSWEKKEIPRTPVFSREKEEKRKGKRKKKGMALG